MFLHPAFPDPNWHIRGPYFPIRKPLLSHPGPVVSYPRQELSHPDQYFNFYPGTSPAFDKSMTDRQICATLYQFPHSIKIWNSCVPPLICRDGSVELFDLCFSQNYCSVLFASHSGVKTDGDELEDWFPPQNNIYRLNIIYVNSFLS